MMNHEFSILDYPFNSSVLVNNFAWPIGDINRKLKLKYTEAEQVIALHFLWNNVHW